MTLGYKGYPVKIKLFHQLTRLIIVLFVLLWLPACTHLMFAPMKQLVRTPDRVGVEYKDIAIESEGGVTLHGWHLPATVDAKGSILFFHGNGENISTHLATVFWLPDQGYEVFLVDYRGYGKSEGEVDLKGSLQDVNAAIDYTLDHKQSEKGLIIFGHSFGASLSLYAVASSEYKNQINSVVAIGGFSDYRKVTRDALSTSWLSWAFQWPLSFTINNDYAPVEVISNISPVPVVIMHSPDDEIVPYYHSGLLFEAAAQPKYFVELEGDHNHPFLYEKNRQSMLDYLERFSQ